MYVHACVGLCSSGLVGWDVWLMSEQVGLAEWSFQITQVMSGCYEVMTSSIRCMKWLICSFSLSFFFPSTALCSFIGWSVVKFNILQADCGRSVERWNMPWLKHKHTRDGTRVYTHTIKLNVQIGIVFCTHVADTFNHSVLFCKQTVFCLLVCVLRDHSNVILDRLHI